MKIAGMPLEVTQPNPGFRRYAIALLIRCLTQKEELLCSKWSEKTDIVFK